jgi:hypothetical protein
MNRSMNRFPRPAKQTRRAGGGVRQIAVVLTIGACLGISAFALEGYAAFKRQATVKAAAAAAAAVAANDEELYTGSILYMPDRGSLCRQLTFDNQNGQFTDMGAVDCERAAYHNLNEEAKHWSAARVRVISSGFRGQ